MKLVAYYFMFVARSIFVLAYTDFIISVNKIRAFLDNDSRGLPHPLIFLYISRHTFCGRTGGIMNNSNEMLCMPTNTLFYYFLLEDEVSLFITPSLQLNCFGLISFTRFSNRFKDLMK